MSTTFDVIVVGNYTIDLIFSGMTEFPQLGKDVKSHEFKATPGEAFIPAVSLHRLGVKVGWATDFGNDEYSKLALQCARDEGMDESFFVFHDRPLRRISIVITYPEERGFLTYYDPDPEIPAAIPALLKSEAKLVYVPGLFYGKYMDVGLKLIHMKKMKLAMDGNSSRGTINGNTRENRAINKAIHNTDIFLPNAQEALRLTGELDLITAIYKLGELCPLVVVKNGSQGSLALTDNALINMHGIPINPIDTTGAGDNFNAGFIRAWLDGLTIEECLKWGNIMGGLSATQLGGTTNKIDIRNVKEALDNYPTKK